MGQAASGSGDQSGGGDSGEYTRDIATVEKAWKVATKKSSDRRAQLSRKHFVRWAIQTGIVPTKQAAKSLFEVLDADHNRSLSFEEFARTAFLRDDSSALDVYLETIFLLYDENGDGQIGIEEIRNFLLRAGKADNEEHAAEAANRLWALIARCVPCEPESMHLIHRSLLSEALKKNEGLLDELFVTSRGATRIEVSLHRGRSLDGQNPKPTMWLQVGRAQFLGGASALLSESGSESMDPGAAVSEIVQGTRVYNSTMFNDKVLLSTSTVPPEGSVLKLFILLTEKPRRAVKSKKIGFCEVFCTGSQQEAWVPVKEASGELQVSIRFLSDAEPWVDANLKAAVPFKLHHSAGGAVLAGEPEFLFFELKLARVAEVFRNVSYPWNKDYDKAKIIFGKGPQSAVIRSLIRATHKSIYGTGIRRTQVGYLRTGAEFLDLLSALEDVKMTYVLTTDGWLRFSATGATFAKDFLSKHCLHSGCAEHVRYAGEMFVHGDTLYLDNGSGTYGPSREHLDLMRNALLINFPDLIIDAHNFEESAALLRKVSSGQPSMLENPLAEQMKLDN